MAPPDSGPGIRLLVLDVDGVLSDGRVHVFPDGQAATSFHVRDGLGLGLWLQSGRQVALVSGRGDSAVQKRAEQLGIQHVRLKVENKSACLRELRESLGIDRNEIASIGDDLPDLGLFAESGLRIAVADAVEELRTAADMVTRLPGGKGAVREVIEHLLQSWGEWDDMVTAFS